MGLAFGTHTSFMTKVQGTTKAPAIGARVEKIDTKTAIQGYISPFPEQSRV